MPSPHTLIAHLARRFGLANEPAVAPTFGSGERRRIIFRCDGCGAPGKQFVYMSSGGHCCMTCARGLVETFGHRLVGNRVDDITSLDKADEPAR